MTLKTLEFIAENLPYENMSAEEIMDEGDRSATDYADQEINDEDNG